MTTDDLRGPSIETQNKLLARRLLEEVVNTGAVHRLAEFLAGDCLVLPHQVRGLEWFREHLLTFHRCYPDLAVTVDGQMVEADTVATWWTMRGTHLGAWEGIEPTGKAILLSGVNIQKIRHGRIVEHIGFSNSLEALMALGVVEWANPGSAKNAQGDQARAAHPRLAKVHSKGLAEEYQRLGWTLKEQFRTPGETEPYEYLLEWLHQGEPPAIGQRKP